MQTPPNSTSKAQTVEDSAPALKRAKTLSFSDPVNINGRKLSFSEPVKLTSTSEMDVILRITCVMKDRLVTPEAFHRLLDEIQTSTPTIKTQVPTTPRDIAVEQRIMMDKFKKAMEKAHAKARSTWQRSPWARHAADNFCVIDGQTDDDHGNVIHDGCAVCGVVKTECLKPEEHFGARGESPPDSKCSKCAMDFGNRYDAAHRLLMHVATKHPIEE